MESALVHGVGFVSQLDVRALGPTDRSAVLELLSLSLGRGERRTEAWWRWKHELNPCGPSLLMGAFDGSRLVGLRAFLRWRLRWDGSEHAAVRAVDTATHPDYRGRGIFRSLTMKGLGMLADEGTEWVFNTPNDNSYPGYLKMGWRPVADLRMAVRVNNWLRLLGAGGKPTCRHHEPNSAGHSTQDFAHWWSARTPQERAQVARGFDRAAGEAVRTAWFEELIEWRFLHHPQARYWMLFDPHAPCDAVLVRLNIRFGRREGVVAAVVGSPSIGHLLKRYGKQWPVDYWIWRPGAVPAAIGPALRQGFVTVPAVGMHFVIRHTSGNAAGSGSVLQAQRWHLGLGDIELL